MQSLKIRLEEEHDQILTNIPIYQRKNNRYRIVGEIDLLARKGSKYHLYEIKCSYRLTKARLQLQKMEKKLQNRYNITKTFFYCGSSATLIRM